MINQINTIILGLSPDHHLAYNEKEEVFCNLGTVKKLEGYESGSLSVLKKVHSFVTNNTKFLNDQFVDQLTTHIDKKIEIIDTKVLSFTGLITLLFNPKAKAKIKEEDGTLRNLKQSLAQIKLDLKKPKEEPSKTQAEPKQVPQPTLTTNQIDNIILGLTPDHHLAYNEKEEAFCNLGTVKKLEGYESGSLSVLKKVYDYTAKNIKMLNDRIIDKLNSLLEKRIELIDTKFFSFTGILTLLFNPKAKRRLIDEEQALKNLKLSLTQIKLKLKKQKEEFPHIPVAPRPALNNLPTQGAPSAPAVPPALPMGKVMIPRQNNVVKQDEKKKPIQTISKVVTAPLIPVVSSAHATLPAPPMVPPISIVATPEHLQNVPPASSSATTTPIPGLPKQLLQAIRQTKKHTPPSTPPNKTKTSSNNSALRGRLESIYIQTQDTPAPAGLVAENKEKEYKNDREEDWET